MKISLETPLQNLTYLGMTCSYIKENKRRGVG